MIQEQKHYYAFISHSSEDEKIAKWLRRKLEGYHIPTTIQKEYHAPKKLKPIFLYQTDLAGNKLRGALNGELSDSQFLIVICSPSAAKSDYVNGEVQHFIDSGRYDKIIPVIVEGTPFSSLKGNVENECFPPALVALKGTEQELRGIDIREDTKQRGSKMAAVVDVIASMLGIRLDILWNRHKRRRRKNAILQVIIIVVFLLIGCSIFLYINYQKTITIEAQRETSIQTLISEFYNCEKLYDENKYYAAFKRCQTILKSNMCTQDTLSSKFEYILRMCYMAIQSDTLIVSDRYKAEFPAMDYGDMPVEFSKDGNMIFIGCSGLTILNASNGKRINYSTAWPSHIRVKDNKVFTYDDFEILVYEGESLDTIICHKLTTCADDYQHLVGSSADGTRFLTCGQDGVYNVYETISKRLINSFGKGASSASINYNGTIIALSINNMLKLYNTETKEEIKGYEHLYASELQFDQSGVWLLLYLGRYDALNILNLETQENYFIEDLLSQWSNSFNFGGNVYANKYIVSDDNRYIAIGAYVFDMTDGSVFKRLESSIGAMGLKIFPNAQKVIQVNVDQEIVVYTRQGEPIFKVSTKKFSDIIENDATDKEYRIDGDKLGTITISSKSNNPMGAIPDIHGDIYHMSVSNDGNYILINSLAIPLSVYDISTGTLVQSFPFRPGYDGDLGYGVWGDEGFIYINEHNTTYKYKFLSLKELLDIDFLQ